MHPCKTIGCSGNTTTDQDFCESCLDNHNEVMDRGDSEYLSSKYPKYYKSVGNLTEIDVYAVHHLFQINDPAGCIQHASKKLLLSGVRTGGKAAFDDIREARDTLSRWLQLNSQE